MPVNKIANKCGSYVINMKRHISNLSRIQGLPIVHHDGYVCEIPPGHQFPMQKFKYIMDILQSDGVVERSKQVLIPEQVSKDVASSVHTEEYLNKFFNGLTTKAEQKATGFEWTSDLVSRVRFETGGTILAGKVALERGLCCSTAGGTHHAFPERGTGYCLINDLAVTAQHIKKDKVMIVDLDVHQGDGTAFIFQNDASVFTFSMHCESNFPLRKQCSDLDVPLIKDMEDKDYIKILKDHLPTILDNFKPSLVLYDAGVDVHEDDSLGKLRLTDQGLFKRDYFVLTEAIKRGIPVAAVVGGGYFSDVQQLAKRHSILHRVATKVWQEKRL